MFSLCVEVMIHYLIFIFLLLFVIYKVNLSPIMLHSWDQEITSVLTLCRSKLAESSDAVVTLLMPLVVTGILVSDQLCILLIGLHLVSLQVHLHLKVYLLFTLLVFVCTYSQEVEPVFLVHGILCVVVLLLVHFEELLILWFVCEANGFVQFFLQDLCGHMC